MRFTVTIDVDNAAFEEDPGMEVARILRKIADIQAAERADAGTFTDSNGNTVGSFAYLDGFVSEDDVPKNGPYPVPES